jgi:hypothetical protein
MHVFHIRGFSGVMMVLLVVLAALAVLVALPSAFIMVLWNALVFEGSKGPQISFLQGFLLWGFLAVMINVIFKPELKLQFQQVKPKAEKPEALKTQKADVAPEADAASPLENQQEQG